MRKCVDVGVYLSFLFLIYFLYRVDYLIFETIRIRYIWLAGSIILLWTAFLWGALSWWKVLAVHSVRVPFTTGLTSYGISIFGKYIPGKVWTIVGRAAYVAEKGVSLAHTSVMSLKAQIVLVWLGLISGSVPFVIAGGSPLLLIMVVVFITGFTLILFSTKVHVTLMHLLSKVVRRPVVVPPMTFSGLLSVAGYYSIYWGLLILSFFLLVRSLFPASSWLVGFAFPMAASLGILAIVVPGGLGVREGVMTGYLALLGIAPVEATTISVLARLWFVSGELFIFLLALYAKKRDRRRNACAVVG